VSRAEAVSRAAALSRAAAVSCAAALLCAIALSGAVTSLSAQTLSGTLQRDIEAGPSKPAAVIVDGEVVLWITTGIGPYSTAYRAQRISERIKSVVRDRTITDLTVNIVEVDGSSELRVGPQLLMVVTPRDAQEVGLGRTTLASQYAHVIGDAIRAERLRYAPGALLRSGAYALMATAAFALFVWIVFRLTRALRLVMRRRIGRHEALRAIQHEIASTERLRDVTPMVVGTLRVVAIALAADVYLTFVLGLFPWTRGFSHTFLGFVFYPVRSLSGAIVRYLPNLLFLIVIVALIVLATRIVGAFFRQIQIGRLVFANFPPEWADPTNKIARVLLLALGAVVAFPYLPASGSPAFAGVSVFIGVLVSFASSSALSNVMAGIVLTYTGAFRLGDRVKIGDAFGDIIDTSLLATRVRTIKNEEVTIPNSIALGSSVINYTRESRTRGLILHSTVSIGYDVPWRKVHDILIDAALATPGILQTPRPFVWQTALNDFYPLYEINAYTASPQAMADTYAALNERIQDAFFEAGVEIMSPHYMALRDGNTVEIPEFLRPPDYQPRSFRISQTPPAEGATPERSMRDRSMPEGPTPEGPRTGRAATPPSAPPGPPRKPVS
jgi:small-conductance mechanosensitive channel